MIIDEDFATDPMARGWVQVGGILVWRPVEKDIGGMFRLNNWTNRCGITKPLGKVCTQDDDLVFNYFWKHEGYNLDYGNARIGFTDSGGDLRANAVGIRVARTIYPQPPGTYPHHGFKIFAVDSFGILFTSAPSVTYIKLADIPITFWLEWNYDKVTRKLTLDIFDASKVFIETLTLTLPILSSFNVNEVGIRTKDYGSQSGVNVTGYIDDAHIEFPSPPPPVIPTSFGRPFFVGRRP